MENIYEEFGRWISILYRQFQVYINSKLKDLEITSSEYIYLIKLYEKEELTQEELSSGYCIDKAATARSLKRLEEKGYIRRIRKTNDRRSYSLSLTQKALSIKERIYEALKSWDGIISPGIKAEELERISGLLKEMSLRAMGREDFNE